jgi:hypothetical protein
MQRFLVLAIATVACALGSITAHASDVEVDVYETGVSGIAQEVASWTQDQNPTPIAYVNDYYTTVPVFDATGLGNDTAVTWYSGTNGQLGGFTNYSEDFNVLAPTSYSFVESAPTFVPGRYDGVDISPNFTYTTVYYTITVLPDPAFTPKFARLDLSDPPASVPEPGTWAMMLVGLGMIGLVYRRRQNAASWMPVQS